MVVQIKSIGQYSDRKTINALHEIFGRLHALEKEKIFN